MKIPRFRFAKNNAVFSKTFPEKNFSAIFDTFPYNHIFLIFFPGNIIFMLNFFHADY